MSLPLQNSFWEALQTRKLAKKCLKLNDFFDRVYSGEVEFLEWESLRNQVLFPTFNAVGLEFPWIEQATSSEEREALLLLYAPTSPLFKLMMLPSNDRHFSIVSHSILPPGTHDAWNKMGPQHTLPLYRQRQCAQGFQFSIFEYFLIVFANYPVSEARRLYEEDASLSAESGAPKTVTFDAIIEYLTKPWKSSDRLQRKNPSWTAEIAGAPECDLFLSLLSQYLNALICINPPRPESMYYPDTGAPNPTGTLSNRELPPTLVGRRQLVFIEQHFDNTLKENAYGELSFNFVSILLDNWLNQMATGEFQPFRAPSLLQAKAIRQTLHHLFRGTPYLFDDGGSSMQSEEIQSGSAQALNSFCMNVLKQVVRKGAFHMLRHSFNYSFWNTEQYGTLECLVGIWADLVLPWRMTYAYLDTSFKLESMIKKRRSQQFKSQSKRRAEQSDCAPSLPGPPWWLNLSIRARSDYSREFLVLAFPLLKSLFRFLARAPMRNFGMIRIAQAACDVLHSQNFRDSIQQTESLLSLHCGDRDPNYWLSGQKQVKDAFSFVLEKPSENVAIEKFRQFWSQNASQTITDSVDLIQYAGLIALNLRGLETDKDVALGGAARKLLTNLDLLFGISQCERPPTDESASQSATLRHQLTDESTAFSTPMSSATLLRNRSSGTRASGLPPMTQSGTPSRITKGKRQIVSNKKNSCALDAKFQGDSRYAPITSLEVAFLVRVFFQISLWYQSRYGPWVDLRRFARKDLVFGLVVAAVVSIFIYNLVL